MKLFTYLGLLIVTVVTIILSVRTFYYTDDVNPILFIAITFVILIFCLIKIIEEIKNFRPWAITIYKQVMFLHSRRIL